jgi:hypothetical protein
VLDSMLEPVTGVEVPKKVFTSRASDYSYDVELYASANDLYFDASFWLQTLL